MIRGLLMDTDKEPRINGVVAQSIAVIALTKKGVSLARKMRQEKAWDVYIPAKFRISVEHAEMNAIEGNFIEFIHKIFSKYQGLVFISATGIAVRAIAGVVTDKRRDPAVVVVDDGGRFSISLLSGHLGGANRLAQEVAKIFGATPVVTTASDISGFDGIDVVAKDLGLYIDNFEDLKHVSASIVNGEKTALITMGDFYPGKLIQRLEQPNIVICDEIPADAKAVVYATDYSIKAPAIPHVILRPRNIVLGVGARRGATFAALKATLVQGLSEINLSEKSVGGIATIDIKRDEGCILELGRFLEAPIQYYTARELATVEEMFPVSSFVKQTVGVGSVAGPSGFIASGYGKALGYHKGNGITLSIYKRGIL